MTQIKYADSLVIEFARQGPNQFGSGACDVQKICLSTNGVTEDLLNKLQSIAFTASIDEELISVEITKIVLDSNGEPITKRPVYEMGSDTPLAFISNAPQFETITYSVQNLLLKTSRFVFESKKVDGHRYDKFTANILEDNSELSLLQILPITQFSYSVSVDDIVSEGNIKFVL